jgi:hypothetical protein
VPVTTDTEIRPYRVEIPDADIDGLRERLDRVRWPDELDGVDWLDADRAFLPAVAALLRRPGPSSAPS